MGGLGSTFPAPTHLAFSSQNVLTDFLTVQAMGALLPTAGRQGDTAHPLRQVGEATYLHWQGTEADVELRAWVRESVMFFEEQVRAGLSEATGRSPAGGRAGCHSGRCLDVTMCPPGLGPFSLVPPFGGTQGFRKVQS